MTINEVFVTKMSHDLAGVIGTLGNTAELAEIDASFVEEGIALLKESAAVLNARLKFFRALLGLNQPIEADMAERYLKTHTPSFQLNGFIPERLSLAWILLATECLLRGGVITISPNACRLSGETVLLDEVKEKILTGAEQILNPQYMAALWIQNQAAKNNQHIEIQKGEKEIIFRLV